MVCGIQFIYLTTYSFDGHSLTSHTHMPSTVLGVHIKHDLVSSPVSARYLQWVMIFNPSEPLFPHRFIVRNERDNICKAQ